MIKAGEPVAVTGLGCLCAAGGSVQQVSQTIFAGVRQISWRDIRGQRYPLFALNNDSIPAGYFEGPECKRCGKLAVQAAREALHQSGLTDELLAQRKVGVCIGTTVGSAMNNESFYREFKSNESPSIEPIRHYLMANPAAMVSKEFNLNGPCQTITNACSSGAVAIANAADWIKAGVCDVVIAGGADMLCSVISAGFLSLLITDSVPCRPFDKNRKGLNLGEGAGVIVLESQDSIQKRDAKILSRLCGYGNATDAYHISAPEPSGRGLRKAIEDALTQAGISASDIDFINAHGTGTPENDRCEGKLFNQMFPNISFGSTKCFTGHTLGAAGGIEAVITILCLLQHQVPANAGFEEIDPEFNAVPVLKNTVIEGRYGLSDSIAFGGNNLALIFQGNNE